MAGETFTSICKDIEARRLAPVYLIHGDESYYVDELAKRFETVLPEADRDFNQYIFYAPQVEAATVFEACQRYPMMADRQVVILKEAQAAGANYLKALIPYAENPTPSTLLVILCRGEKAKPAEFAKAVLKGKGVVLETKKLREDKVGNAIRELVGEKGLNIEEKALGMLQEYVGTDLARLYNEIDKLLFILGKGAMITPEAIERNIGVSKDFNNSELIKAIARRDAAKCLKAVDYFRRNPRNCPAIVTSAFLFNFFSNLLIGVYAKDKTERGLMAEFGYKWPIQLSDIKPGMQNYNAWQLIEIIGYIRLFEAQSKGVGSRADQYDLLEELVLKILNATGKISL